MELLTPLLGGVALLADPFVWLAVLAGTLFGVVAGGMPGIGTTLAYGLVLPFTFVMPPVIGVAFLLAISVGVGYGNSIPAILMGIPGNPAAILTVIDGHRLHKDGKSGLALGVSFVAALGGQFASIFLFVFMVVPLMAVAYFFSFPEIFGLYCFGFIALISLAADNMTKGIMSAAFGIAIGLVGLDPINMVTRLDMGFREIRSGFEEVAMVIGILALSELFRSSRQVFQWQDKSGEATGEQVPEHRRDAPRLSRDGDGHGRGDLRGRHSGSGGHACGDDQLSGGADAVQGARAVRQGIDRGDRGQRGGAECVELG